jgi:hypothetical protein
MGTSICLILFIVLTTHTMFFTASGDIKFYILYILHNMIFSHFVRSSPLSLPGMVSMESIDHNRTK